MSSSDFFGVATIGYILAMIIYITYAVFKNKTIGVVATIVTIASFLGQTTALILRWIESYSMGIGRAPLTNLYESLVFFVWCLILGYLFLEFKYKKRIFGTFVTPVAGIALAFISLTGMSTQIQPLMPALKSNWLLAHVTMSFIAYSAFAISFVTSILYLAVDTKKRTEGAYIFWTVAGSIFFTLFAAMAIDVIKYKFLSSTDMEAKNYLLKSTFLSANVAVVGLSFLGLLAIIFVVWRYGHVLKNLLISFNLDSRALDELTYKSVAVGFPVFTVGGLIFGAIWADQAWGTYWSWDPKETWSLISWLFYAVYLHTRLLGGWRGRGVAIIAVTGFITIIFTYLGVNIFLSGLHSYGDLS